MPCESETAAVSVHTFSVHNTIMLQKSASFHLKLHVGCIHVCLAVTCHLHLWQNDWDILRATAVTWWWNRHENKSQHRKLTPKNKNLTAAPDGNLNLQPFDRETSALTTEISPPNTANIRRYSNSWNWERPKIQCLQVDLSSGQTKLERATDYLWWYILIVVTRRSLADPLVLDMRPVSRSICLYSSLLRPSSR